MTTTKTFHVTEKAALKKNGAVWDAVLITVGKGSSGDYTEEILENAAANKVFPKGTKLWFKHKEWRGDQRDPRDQWGVLQEDARYEGEALRGPVKILRHWVEVVESLAEEGQADLSIWAAAAVNEMDDSLVAILPNVTNSVDLVDYPGRPGSGLAQKIERARESYKPAATSAEEPNQKEIHMDEKDIKAIAAAVTESLKPIVDFVTNAKTAEEKEAQAKVDDQAVESAVTEALTAYDEKVAAIKEAKLFPSQEAALIAEARKGADVTEAIAEAAKVVEEAKTVIGERADEDGESTSYVLGERASAKADKHDYTIRRGGNR